MIVVGAILLILGFVFGVHLLTVLGVVLLVVGAVMWAMGSIGRDFPLFIERGEGAEIVDVRDNAPVAVQSLPPAPDDAPDAEDAEPYSADDI